MIEYIALNIRYLRKVKGLTQEGLANMLEVKRAVIGSYEEGRALPRIGLMQKMAAILNVSLEDFTNCDLSQRPVVNFKEIGRPRVNQPNVLATVVDNQNIEQMVVIPQKASAGYTSGYADPEFVSQLPILNLPLPELASERTYRTFQISGDSMLPVPSGSYVITEYVTSIDEISDGSCCIILTHSSGIVYKRLYKQQGEILLKSDNSAYVPYSIPLSEVLEIWRAVGYISLQLPSSGEINSMHQILTTLKEEINQLKSSK
jgi:transcriptional regulator with XRE-family HTH domain